ncbi:VOC family protein [Tahibacter soli]|uniref:VOC family protein n=1 Tax=Tahibacter soli TaxID=2983605 RepID=A0A9X3YR74_9GAMM|nr:VOC family protein [Tahibacter soli]MDC8016204.1 VOC family protein [Tahibacter soli]
MNTSLRCLEIKAFVPARDFERSLAFYRDLGFTAEVMSDDMAYLYVGRCSFLLQRFYVREHAENFMMHLMVENADAWWGRVVEQDLAARYGVHAQPPEDRPWGLRDFTLGDPTGVLWRVAHEIVPGNADASAP